jgi:hypothetical protein
VGGVSAWARVQRRAAAAGRLRVDLDGVVAFKQLAQVLVVDIRVLLLHEPQDVLPQRLVTPVPGRTPAVAVSQPGQPLSSGCGKQPVELPLGEVEDSSGLGDSEPPVHDGLHGLDARLLSHRQ